MDHPGINREQYECRNYLSPNRREFYKILLITKGTGVFTMGLNTYYIEEPTLLFIHPNDIISWKNLSEESGGFYVLFKKSFINHHLQLKTVIDKFGFAEQPSFNLFFKKNTGYTPAEFRRNF